MIIDIEANLIMKINFPFSRFSDLTLVKFQSSKLINLKITRFMKMENFNKVHSDGKRKHFVPIYFRLFSFVMNFSSTREEKFSKLAFKSYLVTYFDENTEESQIFIYCAPKTPRVHFN